MSRSAFVYRGSRSIPSKFSERSFSIWCQTYLWTCKPISSHFKGQGYSEKLTIFVFGYSKVAFSFSTHRSFSLWIIRDFGGPHYETILTAEIGGKKKTSNCVGAGIVYFFPSGYPLNCLQCVHFGVWSIFGSIDEKLLGRHLDKISRTEWRRENAACLQSAVQNGCNDVRILGFFGYEFHRKNLRYRGWNFGEWLILVQGFLLALTNNIRIFEWPSEFSFKDLWPAFAVTR